ncbi:hypothetical protein ACJJTC_014273 [Scirpophaga incertulas]
MLAEFSGGGIPPDISTCDIGANEECLAFVASYSSESSLTTLVSDSDVKSLGFSIKGEKRPRHKERRPKDKRSKVFIEDSSLSIPLGQQDPSSQDSSILLGQNQSTNNEQTELNSIINVISGSVADTQTTQQSHVLSVRQPIGRQNYCASDKGPFIVHIQKFRQRFTKAGRKKDYFLSKNSAWLDGIFTVNLEEPTCQPEPSTSEEKRGRPSKTYEDSSVSTKKRKNKELLDTCGLDFILNSYTQGLRARGEGEEALIVEVLRTLPPEKKSEIRYTLLSEPAHLTAYTKDEALGIFIELNLSKAQYENMRSYLITKNCLLFPSYT